MKLILTYLSLVILFLLLTCHTRIYSDFTASRSNIVILPLLIILVIINVTLLYHYTLKKQKNLKIPHLVIVLFTILFGLHLVCNYHQSKKEIAYELYISPNIMLKQRGYDIKLYADETYEINDSWHGESNHYFGTYKLSGDTLLFKDHTIQDKTEDQITTYYKKDHKTGNFKSLNNGYNDLKSNH